MTGIAGNSRVSAVKHEIALGIVIEQPQVPRDRVMAGLAVIIVTAGMRIVLDMAATACGVCFGKLFALVTGVAFKVRVLTE